VWGIHTDEYERRVSTKKLLLVSHTYKLIYQNKEDKKYPNKSSVRHPKHKDGPVICMYTSTNSSPNSAIQPTHNISLSAPAIRYVSRSP